MHQKPLKYYASLLNVLLICDDSDITHFESYAKKLFNSIDISDFQSFSSSSKKYHLVVVIEKYKALLSLKSADLKKFDADNYMLLCSDKFDDTLYKQALGIGASFVDTLPSSENDFVKLMRDLLPPLVEKYLSQRKSARYEEIVEDADQNYLIYEDFIPLYISQSLKDMLNVDSLSAYEEHLMNIKLTPYLKSAKDEFSKVIALDENQNFLVQTKVLKDKSLLVHLCKVALGLNSNEVNTSTNVLNRLSFIEELKDVFLSRTFEAQSTPLISVNIDNYQDIIQNHGIMTYHDILINFSKELSTLCENNVKVSQWTKNVFCILSSSVKLETLKDAMQKIQDSAVIELNPDGIAPIFHAYIMDVKSLDLNKTVELIDNIDNKKLTQNSLSNLEHFEISSNNDVMKDEQAILYYLQKQMLVKLEVKLLNFYKGLSINTPARLVKIDGDNVYIKVAKIQAYAMKLDGTVLIQSANMPMDISAKVKLIDINKKIAMVSDFVALKESANNRRHIRVSSDHRMHISLSEGRNVFSANIIDISIKSIACRVSLGKNIPELGSKFKVQFQLPLKSSDEAAMAIVLDTKVAFILKNDAYIKLVLDMDLVEPYESYLLEYIYERQQTLIKEVKQIALKLQ